MMYLRVVIPINLLELADEISRSLVEVLVALRHAKQCHINFFPMWLLYENAEETI